MVISDLGKIKADKYSDAFYPIFSLTNIQKQILSHFGLGKADYDNLIGELNLVEQATCVNKTLGNKKDDETNKVSSSFINCN